MTDHTWEMTSDSGVSEAGVRLMQDGWEPFSVLQASDGKVYFWFRRKVPAFGTSTVVAGVKPKEAVTQGEMVEMGIQRVPELLRNAKEGSPIP